MQMSQSLTLKLARLNDEPEIFHTIQGEGVSMGVPAIFIRSSLCNLHCQWCDTDYTWNWEGTPWKHENDAKEGYKKFKKEDYIMEFTTTEVAEKVKPFPCQHIILTGGEPLIQEKSWMELMNILISSNPDYVFEVETNGTIQPSQSFDELVQQYNVSPKLKNSGNSKEIRQKDDALSFFSNSPKAWFKFVIANEADLKEVEELKSRYNIAQNKILLMPEGRDNETLEKKRLWLADLCREKNYRYSDRLHIQLWGSKRGV